MRSSKVTTFGGGGSGKELSPRGLAAGRVLESAGCGLTVIRALGAVGGEEETDFDAGCGVGSGEEVLPALWCWVNGTIVVAYQESVGAGSEVLN
ncbi:hypothetical protein NDU88_002222 [Pleurodeles waltl]|uniref:Uncharacterized protein n=1 Tax=Pleurodeles waltl TaxID=8319 RepID=A0AAV7VYQ9_PLEWA|nr:hypothetical protein NDU88_002222 [Pleurodeles waltl]